MDRSGGGLGGGDISPVDFMFVETELLDPQLSCKFKIHTFSRQISRYTVTFEHASRGSNEAK